MSFAEVTIERILPGGLGLAHWEGFTVFVALAAPGDVVRVRIDRERGKVAFASIVEIIKPSDLRVEPPCPYFGRCGGCDFQQLNYQSQLDSKVEIIRDCLRRIAQIEEPPGISIHASPKQWQYRMRANWQLDPATKMVGYFEAGSHRVCDVELCAVLTPRLQQALEHLRREVHTRDAVDLPKDFRAAVAGEEVSMAPPLFGSTTDDLSISIGGEIYRLMLTRSSGKRRPPGELVGEATERQVRWPRPYCALDCSPPLARRFERVIGVEVSGYAVAFARRNLQQGQFANTEVVNASLGQWLRDHSHSFPAVDFLLLDPPRTGAENIVIGDSRSPTAPDFLRLL